MKFKDEIPYSRDTLLKSKPLGIEFKTFFRKVLLLVLHALIYSYVIPVCNGLKKMEKLYKKQRVLTLKDL